jgi:uroporphyrinogen-III synthase
MNMSDNPTILVTRPEPQASRFATACRKRLGASARVMVAPLMAPEFEGDSIDGAQFAAAIFTSETGVTGAARLWDGPKGMAFAVGDRTAEAANALGWNCISADGDMADLAKLIAESGAGGPMIWARGSHVAGDFGNEATARGVSITECQVYRQIEQDLPVHARAVLDRPGVVVLPLFSPRSAKIAQAATEGAKARVIPIAISSAAAAGFGAAETIPVARHPGSSAMLDAIAAIFRDLTA